MILSSLYKAVKTKEALQDYLDLLDLDLIAISATEVISNNTKRIDLEDFSIPGKLPFKINNDNNIIRALKIKLSSITTLANSISNVNFLSLEKCNLLKSLKSAPISLQQSIEQLLINDCPIDCIDIKLPKLNNLTLINLNNFSLKSLPKINVLSIENIKSLTFIPYLVTQKMNIECYGTNNPLMGKLIKLLPTIKQLQCSYDASYSDKESAMMEMQTILIENYFPDESIQI